MSVISLILSDRLLRIQSISCAPSNPTHRQNISLLSSACIRCFFSINLQFSQNVGFAWSLSLRCEFQMKSLGWINFCCHTIATLSAWKISRFNVAAVLAARVSLPVDKFRGQTWKLSVFMLHTVNWSARRVWTMLRKAFEKWNPFKLLPLTTNHQFSMWSQDCHLHRSRADTYFEESPKSPQRLLMPCTYSRSVPIAQEIVIKFQIFSSLRHSSPCWGRAEICCRHISLADSRQTATRLTLVILRTRRQRALFLCWLNIKSQSTGAIEAHTLIKIKNKIVTFIE